MKFRQLGNSGLQVSLVGLGCNNFGYVADLDVEASRKVVDQAIDCGITLFDTSDSYGPSEDVLGQVLGNRRYDIVLATKFASQLDKEGKKKGGSRRYILNAVESSLRRLKTDYIDLYQMHRPDPLTPIEETLRALDDLVHQGKVRYIGCSNFSAWQVVEAEWTARSEHLHRFVSAQDEYSLLVRDLEQDRLPVIEKYKLGLLPYFPLASGLLTGKYKRGQAAPAGTRLGNKEALHQRYFTAANLEKVNKLQKFASDRGHSLLELAFSWLAACPATGSVIAGATKPEQVEANAKAAEWELTSEELKQIDELTATTTA